MNIQQYYRIAANTALNGSLVAFLPMIIIVCFGLYFPVKLPMFLIVLPFCLYSFICYQNYLIQNDRSNEVDEIRKNTRKLSDANHLLITFLPAPSLRMLLFDENGILIGEVRDKQFWWWRWFLPYFIDRLFPSWYGLYDNENQLVCSYQVHDKMKNVKIFNRNQELIGLFNTNSKKKPSLTRNGTISSMITGEKIQVQASSLYHHIQLHDEQGAIIGKLIKGWMPQEWGDLFRDANTPYITFSPKINESEKMFIIGVLTEYFRYSNH